MNGVTQSHCINAGGMFAESGTCGMQCAIPPTFTPTATPTATPTNMRLPDGADCTRPIQCQSNFCVTGVCCDSACDGPLEQCNLPNERGTCASAVSRS